MKKTILAITLLFTTCILSDHICAQGLNPGDEMPTHIRLKNANGRPITFEEVRQKNGLLVMFSCNTCPFVIKNEPITKKVMEYAAAHEVGMVILNSNEGKRNDDDSYDAMVKFAKEQHYTVPYLLDGDSRIADIFGANHTPEVYLFNHLGILVYKGAMNDNPGDATGYKKMYIEDAINAMISGKDPDPKVTKSIGCSIKRKA